MFLFSSLSSSFLSSSSSSLSLFWSGEKKKEKKYISRKKRAFSYREREEYSHHHLRSRGTEGKETLAVITSSLSFCRCCVVRFAARVSSFVTKRERWNIFRDDQKEKEVRKSFKKGGADSAETAQSPKGEKDSKHLSPHKIIYNRYAMLCLPSTSGRPNVLSLSRYRLFFFFFFVEKEQGPKKRQNL